MFVSWKQLTLERNKRSLLKNLDGQLKEGECLAIMGPSGAGKTTFLSLLSGEKNDYSGHIYCGTGLTTPKKIRPLIGYVRQYECFLEYLTPREHLFYQRKLYNPKESNSAIKHKVELTLTNFHLLNCADTIIGSPLKNKGLSGGERKRLAIATEVFWRPKLLLLDEPTSSLDHYSATAVLRCLKKVQEEGITIVMTIHQPSYRSYVLFDRVMVMADGEVLYFGSSCPEKMKRFLTLDRDLESGENVSTDLINRLDPEQVPPHEILIEIASDPEKADVRQRMIQHCRQELETKLDQESAPATEITEDLIVAPPDGYCTECMRCLYLSYRDFLNSKRNPMVTRVKVSQSIFLAFLVCLLYGKKEDGGQHSVQNITGAMFFIIMNLVFSNSFSVLRIFTQHLTVFRREYSKKWYSLLSYFVAKTSSDIIFQVINPMIFFTPVYWLIGFRKCASSFFLSLLTIEIMCLCACSWGYMIASIAPGSDIVNIISPTLLLPFLISGGFLVNSASLPSYISWLSDISFFRYAYENLMIQEWKGREIKCTQQDAVCLYRSGEDVLDFFSIQEGEFWMNLVCMSCILVACRLVAICLLWRKTKYY